MGQLISQYMNPPLKHSPPLTNYRTANPVHLATWNCRTLEKNQDKIFGSCVQNKIDIVALQETYTKGAVKVENGGYLIKEDRDYKIVGVGREQQVRRGGAVNVDRDHGLAFAIKSRFEDYKLHQPHPRIARMTIMLNGVIVILINVYAPSASSSDRFHTTKSYEYFESLTQTYNHVKTKYKDALIIICGDMNATCTQAADGSLEPHIMRHVYDGRGNDHFFPFYKFLIDNSLFQLNSRFNKERTRKWTYYHNETSQSELDYFLCNRMDLVDDVDVVVQETLKDHRMVSSKWSMSKSIGTIRSLFTLTMLMEKFKLLPKENKENVYMLFVELTAFCAKQEIQNLHESTSNQWGVNINGKKLKYFIFGNIYVIIDKSTTGMRNHLDELKKLVRTGSMFLMSTTTRGPPVQFGGRDIPKDSEALFRISPFLSRCIHFGTNSNGNGSRLSQSKLAWDCYAKSPKFKPEELHHNLDYFKSTILPLFFNVCQVGSPSEIDVPAMNDVFQSLLDYAKIDIEFNIAKFITLMKLELIGSLAELNKKGKQSFAVDLLNGWKPSQSDGQSQTGTSKWSDDVITMLKDYDKVSYRLIKEKNLIQKASDEQKWSRVIEYCKGEAFSRF